MSNSDPFGILQSRAVNPWGFPAQSLGDNLTNFIANHPNWVLYARVDRRFPCASCWSPESHAVVTRCASCLGTGYAVTLTPQAGRLVLKNRVLEGLGGSTSQLGSMGYLLNYPVLYFTSQTNKPYLRDIVFEVEWDAAISDIPTIGRAVRLVHAYQLQIAIAMKESVVSYYACGAAAYDFDFSFLESSVLQMPITRTS